MDDNFGVTVSGQNTFRIKLDTVLKKKDAAHHGYPILRRIRCRLIYPPIAY